MIDEEIKKAYSKVTKQYETKSDRVSYKDAKNSFRAIREENEMEFSGVYHKTSEQMSYALDEDRLIVNIKTGYDVKANYEKTTSTAGRLTHTILFKFVLCR